MLAPWGDRSCSRGRRRGCLIEQRNLTSNAVPLGGGGCSQRLIDASKKFGAIAAKKIKGAAFDQALQHFAIGDARIQTAAKILQRNEVPSPFALANGGFHRAFADVFDRGKTVTNGIESGRNLWVAITGALRPLPHFRNKFQTAAI